MKKLLCILIIPLLAASCSTPLSKESYLKKFDVFISEVSKNHKTYSAKDWQKKTEKFEKFSGAWYEKFKDDFTLREKARITKNKTIFKSYKMLSQASSTVEELSEALDEAIKLGSATEETTKEILENLRKDIEKIKKKYGN